MGKQNIVRKNQRKFYALTKNMFRGLDATPRADDAVGISCIFFMHTIFSVGPAFAWTIDVHYIQTYPQHTNKVRDT